MLADLDPAAVDHLLQENHCIYSTPQDISIGTIVLCNDDETDGLPSAVAVAPCRRPRRRPPPLHRRVTDQALDHPLHPCNPHDPLVAPVSPCSTTPTTLCAMPHTRLRSL